VNETRAPIVETIVKEAVASDPVVANKLNGEGPIQSRVLWGNAIAAVGAGIAGFIPVLTTLGVLTPEEGSTVVNGVNSLTVAAGSVIALGGVAYSAYGRLASGLRPLFSRSK